MPVKRKTTSKTTKKSTKRKGPAPRIKQAIELLLRNNPDLTPTEIANNVVQLGVSKSKASVFNTLYHKDYINRDIHTIRNHNREYLDRKLVPLAVKRAEKALRNKDLDEKTAFPYVKLAMDKGYGDTVHHSQPATISIGEVTIAQQVVKQAMEHTMLPSPETIDVTPDKVENTGS